MKLLENVTTYMGITFSFKIHLHTLSKLRLRCLAKIQNYPDDTATLPSSVPNGGSTIGQWRKADHTVCPMGDG